MIFDDLSDIMSCQDHVIDVLLMEGRGPDYDFLSIIDGFKDSVGNLSVARFIVINPNMIAPTNLPAINIGPSHSHRVLQEERIEGAFCDIDGFVIIKGIQPENLGMVFFK